MARKGIPHDYSTSVKAAVVGEVTVDNVGRFRDTLNPYLEEWGEE